MKRLSLLFALLVACNGLAVPASANLLTPPVKTKTFTIGFTELFYHWAAEYTGRGSPREMNYNLGALYMKYGVASWLTVNAQFALYSGDPHNEGISRRYYNLGAGATTRIMRTNGFELSLAFSYFESLAVDNLEARCHNTAHSWAAALQLGRAFGFSSHEAIVWLAPAYSSNRANWFENTNCSSAEYRSLQSWNLIVGTDFVFYNHIELFAHLLIGDYFQPRLGVGYRF